MTKLLFCTEASYLPIGYSTYYNEVISRLHKTGKYEIAELATYGDISNPYDSRWMDVPWKFYPVMPNRASEDEVKRYYSEPINVFGRWKYEETLLDFQPDVVCDIRDYWHMTHEAESPFRPYYQWAIMPAVDAEPPQDEWVSMCSAADAVFSYSDWGLDVLAKQGRTSIKLKTSAPGGIDPDIFKPVPDKKLHREQSGCLKDVFVVGMVSRNQRRKLFPDLFEAFRLFLNQAPPELAKKTYLYLHTSYPDCGWELPRLIKENSLSSKVLFTYLCATCGQAFPSFFADGRTFCKNCGQFTARMPSWDMGTDRRVLANIFNLFDVYVQYALAEGFGYPQVEAAACQVPVFATDYSAMSDVVRKLKGTPIRVQRFFREQETHRKFGLPDNQDFVNKLIKFLSLPEPVRAKFGFEARQAVLKHYTWDRAAKTWEEYFDTVPPSSWLSPAKPFTPNLNVPPNLNHDQFVQWGYHFIAGRPDLANSYQALRMTRDLNWEISQNGTAFSRFTREEAVKYLLSLAENRNVWEQRRMNAIHRKKQ